MLSRQKFFNEAAGNWDKQFYTPRLIGFMEQIVPTFNILKGQKILDVGTGTGILIPFLLNAVGSTGQVTAIDYAERMVEECRAKYGKHLNVTIMVEQVEDMPFPAKSFDVITCFGLFPHLENKEKALDEMNRVLKSNGRLIIVHALSSAEIKCHHHNASPTVALDVLPEEAQMGLLLKRAGFKNIQITDKPGCYLCISHKST